MTARLQCRRRGLERRKVLKQDAPLDASQVGVTASRMPTLASARKIDDMTVELTTKEPDGFCRST